MCDPAPVAVGDMDARRDGVGDGVSANVNDRDPSTVRVAVGLVVALLEAVGVPGGEVETVAVGDAVRVAVAVAAADGVAVEDGVGVGVRKGEMRTIRSALRHNTHMFVPSKAVP